MEIGSLFSAYQATGAYEIDRTQRGSSTRHDSKGSFDTVTLSDRAKELAAEMAAHKVDETTQSAFEQDPNATEDEANVAAGGETSGGQALPGSSEANADQITKLEQQIQALSQEVAAIMSGPGEPENKISQAQPFQQQINSLKQQLQALLAEARSQAKAGA